MNARTGTRRRLLFWSVPFATIGAALGLAAVVGPGSVDLGWYTIESGGTVMTGGDIELVGTIGQHDAGPPMVNGSGTIEIVGGFRAASHGQSAWQGGLTGSFFDPANWEDGLPGAGDTAVFDQPKAFYTVDFDLVNDAVSDRLLVLNGFVTFAFDDQDYEVLGNLNPNEPSLVVGLRQGDSATLRIINDGLQPHGLIAQSVSLGHNGICSDTSGGLLVQGENAIFESHGAFMIGRRGEGTFEAESGADVFSSGDVLVGVEAGSCGEISLRNPGTTWTITGDTFDLGVAGQASLTITGGAVLIANAGEQALSAAPGGEATVLIEGAGSQWTASQAGMSPVFVGVSGPAAIEVRGQGTVSNVELFLFTQGELRGDSDVHGNVVSVGTVRPGVYGAAPAFGDLTINGFYRQEDFGGSDSGSIEFRLGQQQQVVVHDRLVVTGNVFLAGGLVIKLEENLNLQIAEPFDVLASTSPIDTKFDVAFMSGLPAGKLLSVDYGTPAAAGGGQVNLVVFDLEDVIGFDPLQPTGLPGQPAAAVTANFNSDNFPDLAVVVPSSGVAILINDGEGFFTQTHIVTVGTDPSGIAAATLDANGFFDLAVTNAGSDNVSIVTNDGTGFFMETSTVPVGDNPRSIAAARLDANGSFDLAVANAGDGSTDGTVRILVNNGAGAFGAGPTYTVGKDPRSIAAADLDEPGGPDIDLIVVNSGDDTVIVLDNNGDGTFLLNPPIPVGNSPLSVDPSDLDNDKADDLAITNSVSAGGVPAGGTVSVVLNNADGTFEPAVNLPVGSLPQSLASFDLEGDDDVDLAVIVTDELGERVVRILRNDLIHDGIEEDQPTFVVDQDLAQGQDPVLVVAADVDNDGRDDLVAINGAGGAAAGAPNEVRPLLNFSTTCLWSCGDDDGQVGIVDFLALLSQWGVTGESCDFNGGGVGIVDFLDLLSHWGPCP